MIRQHTVSLFRLLIVLVLDVFLRLIVEDMVLSGAYSVDDIHDEGCLTYSDHSNYKHCDSWFLVDVDLTLDRP